LLVPMIESLEAIGIAEALFAIEEVDWYHVGLVDLGMKLRRDPAAPKAADLLADLGRRAKAAGKPLGANQLVSPSLREPAEGVRVVAVPDRVAILNGARLFITGDAA
jgi:2-keto-3-deoxy-L-rhamnonate aldolase RhmA